MADPLTYTQRLKLGAIRVRRDFADQARQRAIAAALVNDYRACEMLHAEADQHEAAMIAAAQELSSGIQNPLPRVARRLTTVEPSETPARVAWRGTRDSNVALARPVTWHEP